MIDVNELRKGVTFEHDDSLWKVLEYQHNKPGRGKATIRVKCRNMLTGANLEMTFNSGERVQDVRLEYRQLQYLYNDGLLYYFMDTETYEMVPISREIIGDYANFLKEGEKILVMFDEGKVLTIRENPTVELKVVEANDGVKGNTANNASKRVKLETGYEVNVPLFIKKEDILVINTETGEYTSRIS